MDFYNAWWWLHGHPINQRPIESNPNTTYGAGMYDLDIYVDKMGIYLEFGPFTNITAGHDLPPLYQRAHDHRLDVGASTFEDALILLAKAVKEYYGDYNGS